MKKLGKFRLIPLLSLFILFITMFPMVALAGDLDYQNANIYIYCLSSSTGTGIDGVVYDFYVAEDIKDSDGVVVLTKNTLLRQITTIDGGASLSVNLPVGKYYAKQSSAPSGYSVNSDIVNIEVLKGTDKYVYTQYCKSNTNLLAFTAASTKEPSEKSYYGVTVSQIENKSGAELKNFVLIEELPYNVKLDSISTGKFNASVKETIYYKTNISSDWKYFGQTTSDKSVKLESSSVSLKNGEYITSVYIDYGTVPSNFKLTGTIDMYAQLGEMTLNGQSIENRVVVSGFLNGTKLMNSAYEKTTVKAANNLLSGLVDTIKGDSGVKVSFKDGVTNTLKKIVPGVATGDPTPYKSYFIIMISSGILVVTLCSILIVKKNLAKKNLSKVEGEIKEVTKGEES